MDGLRCVFDKETGKITIEGERTGCPPYMVGVIFRREDNAVWVIEEINAMKGQILLGRFNLPRSVEEIADER